MSGQDLPSKDVVVRYVKSPHIGENTGPTGSAFILRKDEDGLSVHWLQAFNLTRSEQLAQVRKVCRLERKKGACFAEVNVGRVIRELQSSCKGVRIIASPLPPDGSHAADPSHAEIINLPKFGLGKV